MKGMMSFLARRSSISSIHPPWFFSLQRVSTAGCRTGRGQHHFWVMFCTDVNAR